MNIKAIHRFLQKLLTTQVVDAVFVGATSHGALPMPTLFIDPEKMDGIDPLAPVVPLNAARQAAVLIRQPTGRKICLVLRPCEVRALIELAKLKQCVLDDVLLIGMECLGRMENSIYLDHAKQNSDLSTDFLTNSELQKQITTTCQVCEHFLPANTDINIGMIGQDQIEFSALSERGTVILSELDLTPSPLNKKELITGILKQRKTRRASLFKETGDLLQDMGAFQKMLSACLNCYNCRQACPVCYCRECVFLTDVFAHPPETLLQRAQNKGELKMPTDTTMFHLTRLAHIGHACVGCGHCSSVCPSDIPVAAIFMTVAAQIQDFYKYTPGQDINEPIPQNLASINI